MKKLFVLTHEFDNLKEKHNFKSYFDYEKEFAGMGIEPSNELKQLIDFLHIDFNVKEDYIHIDEIDQAAIQFEPKL